MQILAEEMEKLDKQIETLLLVSGYRKCKGDVKKIDTTDWELNSADEQQMLEEYSAVMYLLERIHKRLAYYSLPVKEEGILRRSESGIYESGRYSYECGSIIEFLRADNGSVIWTTDKMEFNGQDYYILGYPDVVLQGLRVRIRKMKMEEDD